MFYKMSVLEALELPAKLPLLPFLGWFFNSQRIILDIDSEKF